MKHRKALGHFKNLENRLTVFKQITIMTIHKILKIMKTNRYQQQVTKLTQGQGLQFAYTFACNRFFCF